METVEVKILKFAFRFRQLSWREETAIEFPKSENRLRVILSHALTEVSGLKVNSTKEAMKVLRPLPETVIQRIFIVYKGNLPMPRLFSTVGLYKAAEPGKLMRRIAEVEEQRDQIMDRVEREMEQRFGKQELQEQLDVERQMMKNSKLRGATRATSDDDDRVTRPTPPKEGKTGTMPPIKQGFIGKKNAS